MSRAILFCEVPQFYAAVERVQDPALADRPIVVGGDPRKRGLVQAASLEALAAGVEVDMPMVEALRLCPRARPIRTDMRLYREVSRRLLACLRQIQPRLEAVGLAAAFFDLSAVGEEPEVIARQLGEKVADELGLPLRAGIASSRFIAQRAAEEAGEAGARRIPAGEERAFLAPLPVTRLEGVGRKTAAVLAELGAHRIGDVASLGRDRLEEAFGSHGARIFQLASARDDSPVRASRHPQSLSREVTIRSGTLDHSVLAEHLLDLARELEKELERQGLFAGRVALKLRYVDQEVQTRSQVVGSPFASAAAIHEVALRLLERTPAGSRPVRGLGVQLAKLAPAAEADRQLDLFSGAR